MASVSPPQPKILILSDDLALLTALPDTLRLYLGPVHVMVYLSPLLALARVKAERFDVVLTDMQMPEMDGLELLRQVKQVAPRTSVIMMSGDADQTLAEVAIAAGAVNLLSKPSDAATLRKTFQHAIAIQDDRWVVPKALMRLVSRGGGL